MEPAARREYSLKMKEMNKIKFISIVSAAIALCAANACSEDKDSEIRDLAVKAKITLNPYYEASKDYKTAGAVVSPSWDSGDKGVIMLEAGGIAKRAEAAPILPGSNSSLFLFNVQASRLETPVLSWYPSGADVRLSGNTVKYTIPTNQNGTEVPVMFDVTSAKVNSYEGCNFNLKPAGCMVFVNVAMGNYDVASLELTANGGENLAGEVAADFIEGTYSASSASVKMTPATPVDCRSNSVFIPVYCAPVTLSRGFTVKITTSSGQTITSSINEEVVLEAGERISTEKMAEDKSTELVFCGDNHVFVINATIAKDSYKESIVWQWDARSAAGDLGLDAKRCDHLDECKFVDNGSKLLLTSSYGWCALLDYYTSKMLFHATAVPNAHSAEYIPGGYIAVATSTGSTANHNKVQLYNSARSEVVLASADLYSGHGVVWDYKRNVLYAAGGDVIKIFKINGLGTDKPSFELVKSIKTPQGGIHDINRVDDNTITVAGKKAYLFNVDKEQFTEMPLFSGSTALKSLNYNAETGEAWYTDATVPEGEESWSSHKIRYSRNINASAPDRIINVDIDMYKVRVRKW